MPHRLPKLCRTYCRIEFQVTFAFAFGLTLVSADFFVPMAVSEYCPSSVPPSRWMISDPFLPAFCPFVQRETWCAHVLRCTCRVIFGPEGAPYSGNVTPRVCHCRCCRMSVKYVNIRVSHGSTCTPRVSCGATSLARGSPVLLLLT